MVIRIRDDADRRYAADPRWSNAEEHEKSIGVSIISKITGGEFPVLSTDHDKEMDVTFYNILIRPKFKAHTQWGVPMVIGAAFIPSDYVQVVRPGFWEAR
jgi:hypothetical protein